ncbi:MAG: hypothetical protein LHV69_05245 [Elusimicrobia bacterium]|nr:hypothetical protein [Candidatus Obscuribacterium magneticum]
MNSLNIKRAFVGALGCLVVLSLGVGCGPKMEFNSARKLEKKGKFYQAWEKYQEFVASYPKHELAPEALFRAGWVAQKQINDCYMARTFYERVMAMYPQSDPWARAAVLQINSCPDYFPLLAGWSWTEGDSDTKGKNARIEIVCEPLRGGKRWLPSEAGILVKSFYAGDRKSYETRLVYKKVEGELLEFPSEDDPRSKAIMRWPLRLGNQWRTVSDKKVFIYEVKDVEAKVKVAAGEFLDCLQVQSVIEGISSAATNEYYAPGVGRVLTTVSVKGEEKRVTELLSYKRVDYPDFSVDESKK